MNNGYVIIVDDRLYGPYATYDAAFQASLGKGADIKPLHESINAVRVIGCDRPWCAHCADESVTTFNNIDELADHLENIRDED